MVPKKSSSWSSKAVNTLLPYKAKRHYRCEQVADFVMKELSGLSEGVQRNHRIYSSNRKLSQGPPKCML